MADVISFDDFASDHQIELHQRCLVRVVLEGRSDVELFERFWFSHLQDTFEFVAAEDVVHGGGCNSVSPAVTHSIKVDKVPAIGLVDRDTLYKDHKWAVLYEVDDAAFRAATHTDELIVTQRWEIEAYLLEPDLIGDWVAGCHKKGPGSTALCAAAIQKVLEEADVLFSATPYFAVRHASGLSCAEGHFRKHSPSQVETLCADGLAAADPAHKPVAATVKALIDNIRNGLPAHDADRLATVLKYIDTKRLLARMEDSLELHAGSHWMIASIMLKTGRRPAELEAYLEEAARLAA